MRVALGGWNAAASLSNAGTIVPRRRGGAQPAAGLMKKGDRHHKRSWLHRDVLHEGKNCGMASEIQTVTMAGQAFQIGERSEFEPLQAWVRTVEDGDLPK